MPFKKRSCVIRPKFGGYCAFALGTKQAKMLTGSRPLKIYNGEWLLFYNDLYQGQPLNSKILGTKTNANHSQGRANLAHGWMDPVGC